MEKISFKERVRRTVIACSRKYKEIFIDYDYLVCSPVFTCGYYIISAREDNFQHLTGVHSLITPKEFFNKCCNGTLSLDDFDFLKKGQSEKSVKGSVREKISVLENTMELFTYKEIFAEESFKKNKVVCSFATAVPTFTIGFINNKYSTPKSLMKNNQLSGNYKKVDLVIRKKRSELLFNEIVIGDAESVGKYSEMIKLIVSVDLAADCRVKGGDALCKAIT